MEALEACFKNLYLFSSVHSSHIRRIHQQKYLFSLASRVLRQLLVDCCKYRKIARVWSNLLATWIYLVFWSQLDQWNCNKSREKESKASVSDVIIDSKWIWWVYTSSASEFFSLVPSEDINAHLVLGQNFYVTLWIRDDSSILDIINAWIYVHKLRTYEHTCHINVWTYKSNRIPKVLQDWGEHWSNNHNRGLQKSCYMIQQAWHTITNQTGDTHNWT